ncbi:MAG: hypothetical protein ABWY11_22470 [Umezawaea sp.]
MLEVAFSALLLPCAATHRYVEEPGRRFGRQAVRRLPGGPRTSSGRPRR